MSITHQFEYLRPQTLQEAIRVLSENGERARVLAGGTDLIPWVSEELLLPEMLVDIKGLAELKGVVVDERKIRIGALVTFSELIDCDTVREKVPLIFEMAKAVASPGIRNRATLVGNICSAVPSCDSGPVLLVHEADVLVTGPSGQRKVPIGEWFLGPRATALKAGEMVTAVDVPVPDQAHGGCYLKLGRYRGEDLAQASVAVVALSDRRYRIAFGAVSPTPLRASRIESLLNGQELTDEIIAQAQGLVSAEIAPITDIRATREYRLHMARVMLERGLRAARSRMFNQMPPYGVRLI